MTVYAYLRVSTGKQDVENQRFEIEKYAARNNLIIDVWRVDNGVSGTVDYKKRKIGTIIDECEEGDVIIISEISRLGRRLLMIMEELNKIMQKGCVVYSIKENFRLGDDIQCKVLAFAFGLSAEIERNLISQRTKEALARRKAEGLPLGRPFGALSSKLKLSDRDDEVRRMVAAGFSGLFISETLGVHRNTLRRYIRRHDIRR